MDLQTNSQMNNEATMSNDIEQTNDVSLSTGLLNEKTVNLFDAVDDTHAQAGKENDSAKETAQAYKQEVESKNAQSLPIPNKDASKEQWAEFYNQLGRPESAEGYDLPLPQGDDGSFAQDIAPILHQAGLTQAQAQELAKGWNAYVGEYSEKLLQQKEQNYAAIQARNAAQAQELRQEWQDHYDANIELARRAKNQFLPQEHADDILTAIEDVIGVKGTLQLLQRIGRGLAEDDAVGIGRPSRSYNKSAAEVLFDKR